MSANDNFASAIALAGASGSISGNANADTLEAGEPPGLERSVWYSHDPGAKYVNLTMLDPAFESSLFVYTGSAVNALTELLAYTEYINPYGYVTAKTPAGQTYYIRVGPDAGVTAPTGGGFTLAWDTCDYLPAPVSPDRYMVLDDTLIGSGTLNGQTPNVVWPTFGKWSVGGSASKSASGLSFSGYGVAQIGTVHEALDAAAIEISLEFKFDKQAGGTQYAEFRLAPLVGASVSVFVRDFGSGPLVECSVATQPTPITAWVPLPGSYSSADFVPLRLRVGLGTVEVISGSTTLITQVWDGLSDGEMTVTHQLLLYGYTLNCYRNLSVHVATSELPSVEPPAPPDSAFWGGFINSTETLQVL